MKGLSSNKQFYFFVFLITLFGAIIRLVNINYSSLWADELYSALLANPKNSWYEVLYLQRAYQPPFYTFALWVWVKIFTYNSFYIRLFSVLTGSLSIVLTAIFGKKIKGNQLGLLLGVLVAFNPTQIWYSLEARFYVFIYLFSLLSFWIYWIINERNKITYIQIIAKGFVDAVLCYLHHFGIILVFSQFLFELYNYRRNKNKKELFRKSISYIIAFLLYLPWVLWGLTEGIKVNQYWLKEIDVPAYFFFSFGYPTLINYLFLFFVLYFIYFSCKYKRTELYILPIIVLFAVILPLVFSFQYFRQRCLS